MFFSSSRLISVCVYGQLDILDLFTGIWHFVINFLATSMSFIFQNGPAFSEF